MCLNRSRVNKANRRQWPNTKNAARSPLFVFCFVNQCTLSPLILNPTLLRHAGVSFMLQGFTHWASIFWLCCDVLAHFSALQMSDMTVTANGSYPPSPRQRKGWKKKEKSFQFLALKHNPVFLVSPWMWRSYQLLQDEELSIQEPQRKKTGLFSSLAPRICTRHLHAVPAPVRWQLNPPVSPNPPNPSEEGTGQTWTTDL